MGNLDFAVPGRAFGHILLFSNDGSGNFSRTGTLTAGPEPQFIIARDFDGDGDLDLTVLCNSAYIRQVITFLNDGHAAFSQGAAMTLHTARTYDFASGDFDGDGDWDLYIPSFPPLVLLNNGDGTFTESPRPEMGTDHGTPAVGDLDGDGDADLAIPAVTTNKVIIFKNDGSGHFLSSAVISVPFSCRNMASGGL